MNEVKSTIEEYSGLMSERKNFLRLDFSENIQGVNQEVYEVVKGIDKEELSIYPEYSDLIERIAGYCKVKPEKVLPCNGSDEGIKLIVDSFVEKGNRVIIPTPSFAMFYFLAEQRKAKIKRVLYEKDLSFPTQRILNAINSKTKLVILCNPNNPTATSIAKQDIVKILRKAKNAMVLVDEAYYEFSGETCIDLIEKFRNLFVTRTFSKAFGLAGLRSGYVVSFKENISQLKKFVLPYPVNNLAKLATITALDNPKYMENYVSEVNKAKKLVLKELNKLGFKAYPSKANFLAIDFGSQCSFIYNKLKSKEILVRDRSSYPLLKNCLRVSIGTIKQMQYFLKSLQEILNEKIIVFDLDGVLIDVNKSYRKAVQETVEFFSEKKPLLKEIQDLKNQGNFNNDWDLTERLIILKGKKVSKKKIIRRFQQLYLGKNSDGLIKNEKLLVDKEFLGKLSERYRLAVFTGRPKKEAEYALQRFGLIDCFLKVIALEDLPKEKRKPNPFGLKLILNEFNAKKALYVGDTVDDVVAAKNCGVKAIGVLPPQDKSSSLKKLLLEKGAQRVLNEVNELEEVL